MQIQLTIKNENGLNPRTVTLRKKGFLIVAGDMIHFVVGKKDLAGVKNLLEILGKK